MTSTRSFVPSRRSYGHGQAILRSARALSTFLLGIFTCATVHAHPGHGAGAWHIHESDIIMFGAALSAALVIVVLFVRYAVRRGRHSTAIDRVIEQPAHDRVLDHTH